MKKGTEKKKKKSIRGGHLSTKVVSHKTKHEGEGSHTRGLRESIGRENSVDGRGKTDTQPQPFKEAEEKKRSQKKKKHGLRDSRPAQGGGEADFHQVDGRDPAGRE